MLSLSRLRILMLGCVLLLSPIAAGLGRGQGAGGNAVEFQSFDGVKLSGMLYTGTPGKRDATVLIIPDFDLKKGGGIQTQGYDDLAKALQKEGYTVLSFDFRGFGDSKTVDDSTFWMNKHNLTGMAKRPRVVASKYPTTIDHKDFSTRYVEYFVNDIAAAKAFLDQENDNKTCNSSNLIVVGAGYGATLGAMWVANECRRKRDLSVLGVGQPMLGDLQSDDIAGTVWLSMKPSLPNRTVPLRRWIVEGGKTHKIPMAFIHGQSDTTSVNSDTNLKRSITEGSAKKDFEFTGIKEITKTKLAGPKLLQPALGTQAWILDKYLGPVLDKRGKKRRADKKVDTSRYFYIKPVLRLNKPAGVKVPSVDITLLTAG